jgi:hypothetical protein
MNALVSRLEFSMHAQRFASIHLTKMSSGGISRI